SEKDVYRVAMSENHINGDQPRIVLSSTRGVSKTSDRLRVGENIAYSSTNYRMLMRKEGARTAQAPPLLQLSGID
ncbi:MAG TPA: hypothetical protein VEI53_10940, partial [Ktedonobacteraceae bacterium]|nr:hypothetical protein [Ktedonobacteraceae bacterium]